MTVTAVKPAHPIFLAGRWVESPDVLIVDNPADPADAGRSDVHRDRSAVRGGGRGRGCGIRGHAQAARLRARPDPARDQRRAEGSTRGDRPADRPRSRQADPRRAGRGRPRDADLPPGRRGGGTDDRRGHPARPHAGVEGPDRDHAPVPDRPDRRHQPVQLPAQPRRPQDRAGDRVGQPDRAQAAVQGPAHDARRGRDHRGGRRAGRLGLDPADDPRARRPDGRRRAVQAAHLHRLAVGRLADEGARRQEEGRARARRQRRGHRRQDGRPRLGRQALPRRCVQLRRAGLHQRPADGHPRGHLGRVHGAVRRRGPGAQGRRPARPDDRSRADGRRHCRRPDPALGRRGRRDGREAAPRRQGRWHILPADRPDRRAR